MAQERLKRALDAAAIAQAELSGGATTPQETAPPDEVQSEGTAA